MSLNVLDFGAVGDDSTDDTTALQDAIDAAAAAGEKLIVPAGIYRISSSLTIPRDASRLVQFAIQGEFESSADKNHLAAGAVIKMMQSGLAAIQTPALPSYTSGNWTLSVEISDLYVAGPWYAGQGPDAGVGFLLRGVEHAKFHNLHAEGFGTGLYLQDGAELFFTGRTFIQNCFQGAYIQRSSVEIDLQAWFENLVTLENWNNLVLDNPRSVWINNGENITTFDPDGEGIWDYDFLPRRVQVKGSYTDTQLHFANYVIETAHTTEAPFQVDASGVGVLTLERCNFETAAIDTLVRCDGYFDSIVIRDCSFQRGIVLGTPHLPLVDLRQPLSGGSPAVNDQRRALNVVVEGNTPAVANHWVKNALAGHDPLGDVVPARWLQVSPRPQLDEVDASADRRVVVTPSNGYAFVNTGQLTGKGRLYWTSGATPLANRLEVFLPRGVSNPVLMYVTMIVADGGGANVPVVDGLVGPSGDWAAGSWYATYAKLETYVVGGITFQKYAFAISVVSAPAVLGSVRFANFFAPASGQSTHGIESLNLYLDPAVTGHVAPAPRARAAIPAAGSGVGVVGDIVYESAPAAGGYIGWVCTAAGVPGTWKEFGAILP